MNDRFDERLRRRLSALDTAVPTEGSELRGVGGASARRHRVGTSAGLPVGLAAGLVVLVVGLTILGVSLRPSQPGSTPATTVATPSHASGMNIIDAQAIPIPGSGNPVIVVGSIRNGTGRDDKLIGGSSPIAKTAGLYATSGLWPIPTDDTGMANLAPMPWWLIRAGETIELRAGDGEMVLNGLARPLAAGQSVQITFEFAYADPVTVRVPVVAGVVP
ncbi:MAG: copper chaperone PCu(A)C [Candidatus Limnocylindrales bacterium]